MKRKYRYMLLAIGAMLMVGCQKDTVGYFTAVIEDYHSDGDKVYVDENRYLYWNAGDEVKINGREATIDLSTEKAMLMGIEIVDGESYHATYPATSWVSDNCVNFPQEQQYREAFNAIGDMVQVIDAPMVAQTTATVDGNGGINVLNFKNVGALLKVTFSNPESSEIKVNEIEVIGNQEISGNANYSYTEGVPEVTNVDEGGSSVKMMFPKGLGRIMEGNTRSFYIPIIAKNELALQVRVYYQVKETPMIKIFAKAIVERSTL